MPPSFWKEIKVINRRQSDWLAGPPGLIVGSYCWEAANSHAGSKICLGGPLHSQLDAAIDTLKTNLWRKHWKKKHRESTGEKRLTVI